MEVVGSENLQAAIDAGCPGNLMLFNGAAWNEAELSRAIPRPWFVYEVSGEYAAIELMAEKGLISAPAAHLEAWTALTRAGASAIISYGARSARRWLEEMA
jgi:hypothetical protein